MGSPTANNLRQQVTSIHRVAVPASKLLTERVMAPNGLLCMYGAIFGGRSPGHMSFSAQLMLYNTTLP